MREIKFRSWIKDEKAFIYKFMMDGQCKSINDKRILQQYTGLKDINGKEIYEGDIVEHEMEWDGEWHEMQGCEIVYDEGEGIFCFKDDSPNILSCYQNLKVVGNIYENPELMEG